jgi:hypothetical protein
MCNYLTWIGRAWSALGDMAVKAGDAPLALCPARAWGLVQAIEKEHTRIWRTEPKVRKASTMRKTLSATAVLIAGIALLGTSSAPAATLLSLVNPPTTTDKPYDLFFTAEGSTTTISVGGYDDPAFEYVWDISVTRAPGGGANLLGGSWVFTPAQSGSEATDYEGLLTFGDISPGNYDTFSQTFATTKGDAYLLSFDFANSLVGLSFPSDPNGLLVTTSGNLAQSTVLAVPESTTWARALLGFVGLGLVGYCRGRKTESQAPAA